MNLPIRPEVLSFKPYTPGLSMSEIRQKYQLNQVIKLASNENPLGTSPLVQEALRQHADSVFRYPAANNPRLIQALATKHNLDPQQFILGNGSDELLDLILRTCPPDYQAIACNPCFNIYTTQAKLCGIHLTQIPLNPDFSFNFPEILAAITPKTALIFLTSPDNPSGYTATASDLAAFVKQIPSHCLLVLDEAYIHFTPQESDYSLLSKFNDFPNLAIIRTFSKAYGLAGLRLGYGIFSAPLASILRTIRLPFSVNILAEEAGLAALQDDHFLALTKQVVTQGRIQLTQGLQALSYQVYPSFANFLMFTPPTNFRLSAQEIFTALLAKGLIIRPLHSYNLSNHLRISIGTTEENTHFLQTLSTLTTI